MTTPDLDYATYRLFACMQALVFEALDPDTANDDTIVTSIDELEQLTAYDPDNADGILAGEVEYHYEGRTVTIKFALSVVAEDEDSE